MILDEYCKNTHQNRKYIIRKIRSSISLRVKKRGGKPIVYDGYVKAALAKLWDIFDEPCGQRLAPLLKTEVDRLRQLEEIFICNEVRDKFKRISARTIDRALRRQKMTFHSVPLNLAAVALARIYPILLLLLVSFDRSKDSSSADTFD